MRKYNVNHLPIHINIDLISLELLISLFAPAKGLDNGSIQFIIHFTMAHLEFIDFTDINSIFHCGHLTTTFKRFGI